MSGRLRLDLFLVEKGWASSRTHAQELIEAGQVYLLEKNRKEVIKKSNHAVLPGQRDQIHVEEGPANRYVSRGGLKLEGALAHTGLNPEGWQVLDVGISTGGFSDCLLRHKAAYVLGVDVGHGQVSPKLAAESRLKVIEGVNARHLSAEVGVQAATPSKKFDLVVMDVSFISISLIVPELRHFLKAEGYLLSLVKPQFEVGIDGLAKGGIVKDVSLYSAVEKRVKDLCAENGFTVLDYFSSPIQGKDGNNEFFILAKKD